ncbi:hypothetical protein [Paralcaligenes ureilyticus]|uniref:hypothetical protein n=1 Tax=Paralcaligenes ureilyticus TaxID=627131 RepID=UPI00140453B2|nr:hypothetical protein [Paralcaligenes ureilyticus]
MPMAARLEGDAGELPSTALFTHDLHIIYLLVLTSDAELDFGIVVWAETLSKVVPHPTEKEAAHLKASKERGYSIPQQFAPASH